MTRLDWIVVAIAVLGALSGLRRGLVATVLSLAGLVAGAIVGARVAPHLLWVAAAVLLLLPGETKLRAQVQDSKIIRRLNEYAPPRTVLRALARIDPFPQIAGPAPPSAPPDVRVLSSAAVRHTRWM